MEVDIETYEVEANEEEISDEVCISQVQFYYSANVHVHVLYCNHKKIRFTKLLHVH